VTSATDQQPLIGTTVQVKGTGTGTITGIDGDYTLPNVDKNAVLVFSSIGFESQEIAVGGRTTINVVLKEAAELLFNSSTVATSARYILGKSGISDTLMVLLVTV
jgi:TonB-dependent starch-binding outer membrane protein SusC